jgi:putative nucleotidyltransferase with HDIG domain
MNNSLKLHVVKITKIPTLPAIAQEILAVIDDDLLSVNKLIKIIENDPAISSRVLSAGNSVFFGLGTPVKTLNDAIFRIGFDMVKNIAFGISIMTILDGERHQSVLDYQRVFNHSVAVGLTAKLLSRRFRLTIQDEILICGLLHDLGLLILSRYFPGKYLEILNACERDNTLPDAERKVFDFTHADIGNWLAEKWNLPDTVLDTVLYHHTPSLAQNNLKHVAVVHIADYITSQNIIKSVERDYSHYLDHSCLDMLGISEDDLNDTVMEVKSGSLFAGLFI